jgi:hypothetical protein
MKGIHFLFIAIFTVFLCNISYAQSSNKTSTAPQASTQKQTSYKKELNKFTVHTLPISYKFSFDNINAPGKGKNMGLIGINFLPQWTNWLSAGVAGYGSVSGTQGGYFSLGIAGNVNSPTWHHFLLDANLFAGGGGGHSSSVGNGSVIRASAGFMYQFKYFNIGLHYSYFDFPSASTNSSQIGVDISIPDTLLFSNPFNLGRSIENLGQLKGLDGKYLTFSHNYLAVLGQAYFQSSGTKDTAGQKQDGTIGLLGIEGGHFFTPHWYASIQAAGALSGITNGYMDVLAGPGYRFDYGRYLSFTAQLNLGAGGGGKVDTGGGFLVEPNVGVIYRFTPHWGAWLTAGYLDAPSGNLSAMTLSLKALYLFDVAKITKDITPRTFPMAYFTDWRIRVGNQTIFNAKRSSGTTNGNVNLVNINVDRLLNQYVYLSGEGESAYSGKNVGGLAVGLLGVGIQTSMRRQWQIYGEVMAGAAGGGGLALGDGAIIQPKVGVSYFFTPYIGAQAAVGQMFSLNHDLNNTTLDLNLVFRFARLEH